VPERSRDWLRQAERDLETAKELIKVGSFEWSCFIAEQAAEKAVKAVFQKLNAFATGHSIFALLRILSKQLTVDEELLDCGRKLDKYYIPTRYPNSFESGSPYEYFTRREAEDVVIYSKRIVEFSKGILA